MTKYSWNLKNNVQLLVYVTIFVFLAFLGSSRSEFTLPLIGKIAGFILLTFAPGLLILYTLGIDPFEKGHHLLYSTGLSMVFLVFLALFLNTFYPLIGVSSPLNVENVLINFVLLLAVLLLLSFFRTKNEREVSRSRIFRTCFKSSWLALFPLASIIGAYFVNFYAINTIMLVLLSVLAIIPLLVCIKGVSQHLYPVAVLAASLSLQLHKNLITNYVIGADIQTTFYFASLVNSLQAWSPTLGGDSPLIMLSVVPSFYSLLLDISLDWAFKILNSFLYALTPLCVFYIFRDSIGEKAGFYASLFFAFQHGFIVYGTPAKQPIAELFMALILLATFDRGLEGFKKALLCVLFSFAMVNSHYGVPFIFFLSLTTAYIIFRTLNKSTQTVILSLNYIVFFFILFLSWFIITAEGEIFSRFVKVWQIILNEAWLVISAQEIVHRSGRTIVSEIPQYVMYQINMAIYLALTAFMIIGVLHTLWMVLRRQQKITELDALAFSFMFPFFASLFVTGHFGFDRMYVLSSVVLSGYMFTGYITLTGALKYTRSRISWKRASDIFLAALLSTFLLFNSGVAYQLAGAPIESAISLNPKSNTLAYSDAEVVGAKWLTGNTKESSRIFCDYYSCNLFKRFYDPKSYDPYIGGGETKVFSLKVKVKLSELINVLREGDLVYIRSKALVQETKDNPRYLRMQEKAQIEFLTSRIYDNRDVSIYIR